MSRTAESYIDKPRKFLHDLLAGLAGVSGLLALIAFFAGGAFILFLLVAIAFGYWASEVKYTWVKEVEVGKYKLV